MDSLTIYQLRNRSQAHFAAVEATEGIDRFCSSLDWILPAHEAFIPDHPLYLRESDNGFVTLARGFNPRIGRYLQPLEASWCLASPIVGTNPQELVAEFATEFRTTEEDWDLLYLSGIPQDSVIFRSLVRQFHASHRIGLGHKTKRYVASLEGGLDGFLERRSSKFRANLRRSQRLADDEGVTYQWFASVDEKESLELYERVLLIEERSWKGQNGTGILDGGMNDFYRIMIPRLARRGALRLLIASIGETDVAYVFGGLMGDSYRGLQLSFDDDYRKMSLGNLMQLGMIERLCEENVMSYDLGSELEYKARWAEQQLETITMWVWNDH